jgi:hypothetical protein
MTSLNPTGPVETQDFWRLVEIAQQIAASLAQIAGDIQQIRAVLEALPEKEED